MPYAKTFVFVVSARILYQPQDDSEGVGVLNINGEPYGFRFWDYGRKFCIPNLQPIPRNINKKTLFDEITDYLNQLYIESVAW